MHRVFRKYPSKTTVKTLSFLNFSFWIMEDLEVHDAVRWKRSSVKISLYIIKLQDPSQDSLFPPCLLLEFLFDMTMVSEDRENPLWESSIEIQSQESCQDSPFSKSHPWGCKVPGWPWNDGRWKGLSFQSFCESFIRIQHLKTTLFLHVFSWSLGWHRGSLQTWRCHMTCINPLKLLWKFHLNPTSGTLSRLYLSSKSLPGVLEDMEVPDEPGDGVIWLVSTFRSFCKSFIMIKHDVLVVFQKGGNNWPFLTKN